MPVAVYAFLPAGGVRQQQLALRATEDDEEAAGSEGGSQEDAAVVAQLLAKALTGDGDSDEDR